MHGPPRRPLAALSCLALASAVILAPARSQAQSGAPHTLEAELEVPPPLDLPYPQIVDRARHVEGSVSVGTTSDGRLANGGVLPDESAVHHVLPQHAGRNTRHGTDEMIGLLLDAAARVFEVHGARTGIGNISAPGGGDISWSRSHNNGRDADLAFHFVDARGVPVEVETLLRVDRAGLARDRSGRRFDVALTWTLVEALLTSEAAQVQWLFVYEPLERMLLDHARAIGADPDIIALATDVLHQPGDSAPHDDHLHVRIYCSRDDRLEGCTNWGPEWSHADLFENAVETRIEELLAGMTDPSPDIAIACLQRADTLAGERIAPRIAAVLPHAATETRLAILQLLAEYDEPGVAEPIVSLLESDPDPEVRRQAAWLLGYLADPSSAGPLAALVRRGGAPLSDGRHLDVAAAHALRNVYDPASVEDLIAVAADPRAELRVEVDRVLQRTTGVRAPFDVAESPDLAALGAFWHQWWLDEGALGQSHWYREAFVQAGYPIDDWQTAPLATLVRALRDERDAIRFIADRALKDRTRWWTPSEGWTVDRRARFWAEHLGVR